MDVFIDRAPPLGKLNRVCMDKDTQKKAPSNLTVLYIVKGGKSGLALFVAGTCGVVLVLVS